MYNTPTVAPRGTGQAFAKTFYASSMLAFLCLLFSLQSCDKQMPAGGFYTVKLPIVYSYYQDGYGLYYRNANGYLAELNATCADAGRSATWSYQGTIAGFAASPRPLSCPSEQARLQEDITHHAWDAFALYDYSLIAVHFQRVALRDQLIIQTREPTLYSNITAIHCRIYW
ncbi:hypothetical protein [Phnomibacter sp. MR]|uniref:hypothetical protein n=1 Tax=Phnomibacter sp. MR TaxID=3042318 RepID=UPI003A802851